MPKNPSPSIQIDLNEFKLHLHLKNHSPLTLHFDSPSRRFYLSLIALVVNEMTKSGKIRSIPLQGHLDSLVLLNKSIGGAAGSSNKTNLMHRIYTKWKDALPNLEAAPLFKVLGKRKGEAEGTIGKIYPFSEVEKDSWANLFEYQGSNENVRLKFAIDRVGANLDDIVILFEDSSNEYAWEKFVSSLDLKSEPIPKASLEKTVYPLTDQSFISETTLIDYNQPRSYTPKHLDEKNLNTRLTMESERKLVTVLLAEVANFINLSEKLEPEEVHKIIEGYQRLLMDDIHKYEGTVSEVTRHGGMGFFGAPLAHEDHALRACYAALAIQKDLTEYSEKVKKDYGKEIKIRLGLNSGPVIVGFIGNDLHMVYTSIGDTISLASLMEGLATPGSALVSINTQRLVKDYFDLKPVGPLKVKDNQESQEAFELLKAREVKTRIEAAIASGLTKFMGRKKDMEALEGILEKARSGFGQVVGIVGEAGVGKSRLILEMRKMLPEEEYLYLEGRCLHYGNYSAFLPFLDILRSYFEIKEGDPEYLIKRKMSEKILTLNEKLNPVFPPLQELLSLTVEEESYLKLEPWQKREKIFESIRDLLVRQSQNKLLILVIEDLHWIDKSSEEFLHYLIDWLANTSVLLILLYRPEYPHRWASKSYFNNIWLNQLPINASVDMIQSILGEGEIVPEVRDLILDKAGGNPLFLEELTHTLLENGSIQRTEGQFVLSKKDSDIQIPDDILGIIAARMDRLEESLKRILQIASVIGKEFPYSILEAILEMKEELKPYLLRLQSLEFIYPKRLLPELEYIFKHVLIQEVAHNGILKLERQVLHEKIGLVIEQLFYDRLPEFYEILAYHYKQGRSTGRAVEYLVKSGEKSLKMYALDESHSFFKEAYDLLSNIPARTEEEDKLLIELIIKWGYIFHCRADYMALINLFKNQEPLVNSYADRKQLAMFYGRLGFAFSRRDMPLEGYRYLIKGLQIAEEDKDDKLIGYIYAWLSYACADKGNLDEAISYGEKALEVVNYFESDQELFAMVLGGIAYAYMMKGDAKKTAELAQVLWDYGRKYNDLRCITRHYMVMAYSNFLSGDFFLTIKNCKKCIEVSPDPMTAHGIRPFLGACYLSTNQIKEAQSTLQEVIEYNEKFGFEWVGEISQMLQGAVFIAQGNLQKGISLYENMNQNLLKNNCLYKYAHGNYIMGMVYLKIARKGEEKKDFSFFLKNIDFLIENIPFAHKKAEEHFKIAIKTAEEIGAKGVLGQAYHELGKLHKDRGEIENARVFINKAIENFGRCHADVFLKQAREALASLG